MLNSIASLYRLSAIDWQKINQNFRFAIIMTLASWFAAGGIVMIPLLGFSILEIALSIERTYFWYRIDRRQRRVLLEALSHYEQNDVAAAMQKLKQNIALPASRIFLEALEMDNAPPQVLSLTLDGATQAELPILRRFSTLFDIIITASPLLGLLGTVLGLIRSFDSLDLGQMGREGTTIVTGGISEALVSTASGLVVALFALLVSSVFRGLYRRQLALIQEYASRLEVIHLFRYEKKSNRVTAL